jgi:PncC family amidohydrolase
VFLGGVVAYQNDTKAGLLGVAPEVLSEFGAVSRQAAEAMARGTRQQFAAANHLPVDRVVAIATTGVAGPDEQEGKPVGTVFIAVASGKGLASKQLDLAGDREQIRLATVQAAIDLAREQIPA